MLNFKKTYAYLMFFTVFLLPFFSFAYNDDNSIHVDLGVNGCNNNGVCESGETTFSCPSDCTPVITPDTGTPGGTTMIMLTINNLIIESAYTSATIKWNSSLGSITTVKWGETTEVKEGTVSSVIYDMNHKVELINLKPGTMYYFTIESKAASGQQHNYPPTYFFTKFPKNTAYPLNPINVKAVTTIPGIYITWNNPPDLNFSYVRIMRHEDRLRGDPFSGLLVYEGKIENFLDKNVKEGKEYFYTLFSRDLDGNFSSGVGVSAFAYKKNKITENENDSSIISSVESTEKTQEKHPTVFSPTDFFVHQYDQQVLPLTTPSGIPIKGSEGTVIDLNTKTFSDDLLVVTDETGEVVGQYLFSFNKDSGRFQSVIPPLQKEGTYNLKVYRYIDDLKTKISEGKIIVKEGSAFVLIKKSNLVEYTRNYYGYTINFIKYNIYWILILICIILLLFLIYFILKKKKTKQNKDV